MREPLIPLSLYIHFPWCIKKCPYCDFNSHTLKENLPEKEYIDALLLNLDQSLIYTFGRPIISIFMGGGTPSLFSAKAMETLLEGILSRCQFADNIEITLEANPSSVEQQRFKAYRQIGINRISLGIQSFNDDHLKALGRVHDSMEAHTAIEAVQQAGFTNFNLDLMFGLPEQSISQGLADLCLALKKNATHVSWYELTLEPNTQFWHQPPPLPSSDETFELQTQGQALLQAAGYQQYEVSAYSRNQPCQHNLNYWEFGDYLAIGAGSHAKITQQSGDIIRYHHLRHPKQYMDISKGFIQALDVIPKNQLAFEYFLNTLRLTKGVAKNAFSERTGLAFEHIQPTLKRLYEKGWIEPFTQNMCTTPLGYRFLNNVISAFLHDEETL